jgi:hypothetical protein
MAVRRLELIDYKTGSASQLKKKLLDPLRGHRSWRSMPPWSAREQPAAQRLLPRARFDPGSRDARACRSWERGAAALVEGVAIDLRRLREGAALPPLGEVRPANTARRAACAARPLVAGRDEAAAPRRDERPAFRIDGVPADPRAFYATACDPARAVASRPAPAPARPGSWCRA